MIGDSNSRELLEHYRRIIEISQQLGSTYDHQELLRKIVNAAKDLIHTEAASILLYDEASGQLRFAASSNVKPYQQDQLLVPLEGSIAGWIFTHGEPRVIEDVSRVSNHFQGVDETIEFHTRNLLGVPVRNHEKVIGVVQAVNKLDESRFTDDDIITLRTLASQAGVAIENARLFQQSDFIAEMVHELRTPLTALKMSTALLQNPDLPQTKRLDIVDTMQSETERLIKLTNDFLDVARLESGRETLEIEPFDLDKLIQETLGVVQHQADKNSVTLRTQASGITVEADRSKIKQVLLNLLTNAIKYNKQGGRVDIQVGRDEDSDQDFAQIAVADTGYGISRQYQKNMFQKFYRVPTLAKVERGTGLGLTTAKHIVEAHSGRIWLESEENVGSTFYFTLPLLEDDA